MKIRSASSMCHPKNGNQAKNGKRDLSKEYGAPFVIISHKEGSRYTSLSARYFNPPRFLDFQGVKTLGWTDPINGYFRALSLVRFLKMRHHGYHQLILEFYTTLSFSDDVEGFQCRLMGKSLTVTLKKMCHIFGFSEEGHKTVPEDFDPTGFWREITSDDGDFKNGKSILLIKHPVLILMYKYISHGIFGKADSNSVFLKELFCLWCAYTDVPVCIPCFILGAFKSVIAYKRANMCLGNIITAIAIHFSAFNPLDTDMMVSPIQPICMAKYLKDYKCHKSATEEDDDCDGEDSNPAASTWMLISHKLEQMQTKMNDGFRAMEARFDGLEKKVEMKGLGKVESNGAKTVEEEMKHKKFEANESIEKLRLEKRKSDKEVELRKTMLDMLLPRLKKIQEIIPRISSMNVVDLANLVNHMRELPTFEVGQKLGFPDVNAQEVAVLLHGVHATSTASRSRSKGLPNNGDGNSTQPWTREDDIACSVKKSLGSVAHAASGTLKISGEEGFCKTTLSSLAAAGDTITEIHDSDDETKPNRAVETSKRALSSDVGENEMNSVQQSKRNRTERMGKTSQLLNTEQKKGKEVLKSKSLGSVAHASGTLLISGEEGFCKTTLPPLAAAGDTIIEIHDSDEETKPNIAVETSKRALSLYVGENEINFVWLSKRSRTERMGKTSPFLNTERKNDVRTIDEDNVLTRDNGKKVVKSSSDGVDFSEDSDNESLSDSRMEDLIASIRRKKCARKFMYEADMLSAFQQDEELCLNAVCALYRQTLSSIKSKGCLTVSKNGGFSPIGSMSGCLLAEYLIDGDKEMRVMKSVAQVKKQQPDVITQCRKLATVYVGKLFEIYCTGDDPLFCQP